MDWSTFLRIVHIAGTALGVGGTTFLEIYSIKHLKDKRSDIFENDAIKISISLIRFGLILLAFSGLGLMVLWRLKLLGPNVFYSPRFLAKMSVVLILLSGSMLMNFRLISVKFGSALSTASWYVAMILGMWRGVKASYLSIMLGYLVFVVLTYFVLEYFKGKAEKP